MSVTKNITEFAQTIDQGFAEMPELPAEDKGVNGSAQGCKSRGDFYVVLEGR